MIDFLINDVPIANNASFEMREDIRWISPRDMKTGFSGQMIYTSAYAMNHMELDLTIDGWIPAPILASLPPGSIVTIAPTTPISYLSDDEFELSAGSVDRPVPFYNPGLVMESTVLMEVIEGVAALPWEHTYHYTTTSMPKPDVQYRYYLKYIKFMAIVLSNVSSSSRNGYSSKISFRSVNPICALRPRQPI